MFEGVKLGSLRQHQQYRPIHITVLKLLLDDSRKRMPITEIEDVVQADRRARAEWHAMVEQERTRNWEGPQETPEEQRAMRLMFLLGPLQQMSIIKANHPKAKRGEQFLARTLGRIDKYLEKYPFHEHEVQLTVNRQAMQNALERLKQE